MKTPDKGDIIVCFLLSVIGGVLITGFWGHIAWNMVMPLFFGVRTITLFEAYIINVMLSTIEMPLYKSQESNNETIYGAIFSKLLTRLIGGGLLVAILKLLLWIHAGL